MVIIMLLCVDQRGRKRLTRKCLAGKSKATEDQRSHGKHGTMGENTVIMVCSVVGTVEEVNGGKRRSGSLGLAAPHLLRLRGRRWSGLTGLFLFRLFLLHSLLLLLLLDSILLVLIILFLVFLFLLRERMRGGGFLLLFLLLLLISFLLR
ncbi:hypothetical protein PFISCL1PPCAC_16841 [Pristionchus fissidentatus]|uniref:Uncharacterized protein n=1 Tax=Pristionchus fissidentatus TaxID=1538716 RepID=A0AAV5W465_9BILA|nr:hypothetical protein PFISCL1PPCAC_16841 [Pristionchus fissidentatus]